MAENTNIPTEAVSVTVGEAEKKEEKYQKMSTGSGALGAKPIITLILILRIKFILTFIAFILSLPILASIIWLLYVGEYDCEYLLQLRKLQYGIVIGLIITFILSSLALFFIMRSRFPMPGIFLLMIPFILMFIVGLALAGGMGAYKMESQSIPASPQWLKTKILLDNNSWNTIKSCIYDKKACQSLASRSYMMKSYDVTTTKLSPIESGCCRPQASCDMEYVNETYWLKGDGEEDGSDPYDSDCNLWTNDGAILCYNCHACKQGFQTTIERKWITLGWFLVAMAILLVIVHLLLFVVSMWERYGG